MFARVGTTRSGAAAQLRAVAEEGGDRLAALVLERQGRHREPGVVGEQRDHAVDVAALDRVGEAPDELALAGGVGRGARSRSAAGSRVSSVARARCRALLTEASLVSSISATSAARKPSTSRSTSTARWRGGRCCRAATNASSTASLVS